MKEIERRNHKWSKELTSISRQNMNKKVKNRKTRSTRQTNIQTDRQTDKSPNQKRYFKKTSKGNLF